MSLGLDFATGPGGGGGGGLIQEPMEGIIVPIILLIMSATPLIDSSISRWFVHALNCDCTRIHKAIPNENLKACTILKRNIIMLYTPATGCGGVVNNTYS